MIRRRRHFPAGGLRASDALHTLLSLLEDDNAATGAMLLLDAETVAGV